MIDYFVRELDSAMNAQLDWYEYELSRYYNDTAIDLRANYEYDYGWNLGYNFPDSPDLEQANYVNIIKSVIDTLVSKLANKKVRPYFTPVQGTYETRKVIKNVQQFFDIYFDKIKANQLIREAFRAAAIFNRGHIYVNPLNMEVQMLPAFMVQCLNSETRYGEPTKCLIRFLNFPSHLLGKYGVEKKIASSRKHVNLRHYFDLQNHEQIVYVDNEEVLRKEYEPDMLPITTIWYNPPVFGQKTISVVKELDGIQSQLNYINNQISASMQRMPINMFFVPEGSTLASKDLENKAGIVYKVKNTPGTSGQQVSQSNPDIASSQWIELQKLYIQQAYDIVGVSQLSAMGKNILGAGASGAALESMENIEGDRFQTQVDSYVHAYVDLANLLIHIIPKEADILPASINNSSLKWKDVKKQMDLFKVQYSAATAFSKDPQKKREEVLQASQVGLITADQIASFLDQPDLERAYRGASAVADGVAQCIERAIENEEFDIPDWVDYQLLAKNITITENELYASITDNERADKKVTEALQKLRKLEENLFTVMQQNGFVQSEEQEEAVTSEEGIGVAPSAVDVKDISSKVTPADEDSMVNPQETSTGLTNEE